MKIHCVGETINKRPLASCLSIFCLCVLARLIEYFVIKTDKTILAENFLHKIFGILVLAVVLYLQRSGWQSIGFTKNKMTAGIAKGFLLGAVCFSVAYLIECLILYHVNQNVSLSFYVSGFSLNEDTAVQGGVHFVILCVALNIINVWMEEGVFRGLFTKILTEKQSSANAIFLIAFLFGIWHWVMPLRDYAEDGLSLSGLLVMGIGYTILAGIMSVKWSLLYTITGTLWTGLGDHLFNNVIVTNLLHVVSNNEADSMQIVRIAIGQLLSFSIVMFMRFTPKFSSP